MSARLLSACGALTMLLLAGGWATTAKPPDLPAVPTDTCIPLALGTPNGVLMLRLGNGPASGSTCVADGREQAPPAEPTSGSGCAAPSVPGEERPHCPGSGSICGRVISECFDTTQQEEASDVCIQDETEDEPPIVDVTDSIRDAEVLDVMPLEAEVLEVMPKMTEKIEIQPRTTAPQTPSPSGCICPYLQQKAVQAPVQCYPESDLSGSVLDNLKKLKQAAKLYHKAQRLQKNGELEQACSCYEEIQQLCPGSRYDAMAAEKLQSIFAQGKACPEAVGTEEQETIPAPVEEPRDLKLDSDAETKARVVKLLKKCQRAFQDGDYAKAEQLALRATLRMHQLQAQSNSRPQSMTIVVPPCVNDGGEESAAENELTPDEDVCVPTPGVQEEVEQLLEACRQAIKAGCLDEAVELAHRAQALDPTSVDAEALVYRTHMLLQQIEDEKAEDADECVPPTPDAPPEDANSDDGLPDPDVSLRPDLPTVDPKVVDALERVLAESGEPAATKLIIVEEEPANDEEQAEEPVSQWPYLSTDTEMPSLFVPMLSPLSLQEDEDDDPEEQEPSGGDTLSPFGSLNEMLREAVEVLQQNGCIEVSEGNYGSLRYRCQVQVGGVECQLYCDTNGHGYLTVTLLPGASGDLRAAQRAYNQQVIDWIDEVGGVEATEPDANDTDDESVAEDDDELTN